MKAVSMVDQFESKVQYSIVIPVYNADQSLTELYQRLETVFTKEVQASFEVVFVDDASTNKTTWETIEVLHEEHSNVRGFQLMQNAGQQNATMCGLHQAQGNRLIIMDDDLQHQPEEIPKLIAALDADSRLDVIIGVPENRKHSLYRNVGSALFHKVINVIIHKPKNVRFASFILLEKHVQEVLKKYMGNKITTCSLISMNTRNIQNVTVLGAPRKYGESGYSVGKLCNLALNHMFNFSSFPLKVMSVGGGVVSVFALLYASYTLYRRLTGQITAAGFTTIVILISLYSGMLMFSLGIIGQYMVRILRATTYGQQFAIRRSMEKSEESKSGQPDPSAEYIRKETGE